MKIINIKDGIYHREIYFVFECKFKEYEEYTVKKYDLEREDSSPPNARFDKIINNSKGFCHYYIWIEEFDYLNYEYAVLSHEINHLVFEAMRDIGMELCKESEEAYTYYIGLITTNILLEIDKYHESKKKKKSNKVKNNSKSKAKKTAKN